MGVVRKYPFDPSFERLLASTLAGCRGFADRFAGELDPDLINDETVALALRAVRAILSRNGHAPEHPALVIQQIRAWMDDGKISHDKLTAVADLLTDIPPGKEDDVASMVIEPLKQVAKEHAVKSAIAALSKPTGMEDVIADFERVNRIGKKSSSTGILIGSGSFEAMARLRNVDRLGSGIQPLDILMKGGLPRGMQAVIVGNYGVGKSMYLSSQAAYSALLGLSVGYITLELHPGIISSRIYAALLDMPIDDVLGDRNAEAEARIVKLAPQIGMISVEQMEPKVTTHLDIYEWMQRSYKKHGRKFDVLIVDYADKMGSPKHKENDSSYVAMNTVYEGLRLIAESEGIWEFTASQPKNPGKNDKNAKYVPPGGNEMADSMNKARVTDVIIGIAGTPDNLGYLYTIDKHRTVDCAGRTVGPVPHKRWCGRMFM